MAFQVSALSVGPSSKRFRWCESTEIRRVRCRYLRQWKTRKVAKMVISEEGGGSEGVKRMPEVDQKSSRKKGHAIASAMCVKGSLNEALADVASRCFGKLKEQGCSDPPDLAVVFVSARYGVTRVGPLGRESLDDVVRKLKTFLPGLKVLIGCTADGVVGTGSSGLVEEAVQQPAVSLTLAHLPGVTIRPFHVMPDDMPGLDASQSEWRRAVGELPLGNNAGPPSFITIAEPAFAAGGELDTFLKGVDFAYPRCSVLGALAAGGAGSAQGNMFLTLPRDILQSSCSSLRENGLVGVALDGDIEVDSLVAQSCRPLGPVFEVGKVRRSGANIMILEMKRHGYSSTLQSAISHLESIIDYATPAEVRMIESNLCIGVARDVFKQTLNDDDYLIREIAGLDLESGGFEVCFNVKEGERVRFCLKDPDYAVGQFKKALQKYKRAELAKSLVGYSNPPFGAFVFGDSRRGRGLYFEKGLGTRDLSTFTSSVPISGFFSWCGQIGPSESLSKNDTRTNETRSFTHHAATVVAFLRKRSSMTPLEPPESPPQV